jgi:septal ring factor EnvC (AmiA/AmiB activator)
MKNQTIDWLTKTSFRITSLSMITLSLSPAQAAVNSGGSPAVAGRVTETQAKESLKEVEQAAATAADEADQLRQIIYSVTSSPETHSAQLEALKDEINQMGREISDLEAERESLTPWEQRAIDQTLPLLHDAAANTENAIEYFNNNKTHLWTEAYRGYADHVWQDSDQIAKSLKNYLKYAKVHDQERHLQESLRLGAN